MPPAGETYRKKRQHNNRYFAGIHIIMKITHVPITDLKLDTNNPNAMTDKQRTALKESIERFGLVQPLVVGEGNVVINGNQKLAVIQGDPELQKTLKGRAPCIMMQDLGEDDRLLLQQALNKIHGEHIKTKDAAIFAQLLKQDKGVILGKILGKNTNTISKLISRVNDTAAGKTVLDGKLGKIKVAAGDLWQLGRHTLYVGDWQASGLQNEHADLILTDPPYGINAVVLQEGTSGVRNAQGDLAPRKRYGISASRTPSETNPDSLNSQAETANTYEPVVGDDKPFDPAPILALKAPTILFGANHYHDKLPLGQWLVWIKKGPDALRQFNTSDCELAWHNAKTARAVRGYFHLQNGIYCDKSGEDSPNRTHPTQKPVQVIQDMLLDYTKGEGAVIFDPFAGSGTAIIAAENTNRICYACEITPAYAEVCITRWQAHTGKTAEKLKSNS